MWNFRTTSMIPPIAHLLTASLAVAAGQGPDMARLFVPVRTVLVAPDATNLTGAFARVNYLAAKDRLLVTFATKLGQKAGECKGAGFAFKEYTLDLLETGAGGRFVWDAAGCEPGDYGSFLEGNDYYFVKIPTDNPYDWSIAKYDASTWTKLAETTAILDSKTEPNNDPMVVWVNGQLDVCGQYNPGGQHPPLDEGTGTQHRFFSASLAPMGRTVLSDVPHVGGSSMVFANGVYHLVTADAFLGNLIVMWYAADWTFLGSKVLRPTAHWSQGMVFDGSRFYVAYLDTSQRANPAPVIFPIYLNAHLAAFDRDWNLLEDVDLTGFTPADETEAGRPWVAIHGNRLYVSYDTGPVDPVTHTETMQRAYAAAYDLRQRLLVPVVVDAISPYAHYTTDLVLTNRTSGPLDVDFSYLASAGSGAGSVRTQLRAGEGRVLEDVLEALRAGGVAIPSASSGQQAGVLGISAPLPPDGAPGSRTSSSLGVTARTKSATACPHPDGTATVAYGALREEDCTATAATVFGLRSSEQDRSNLAVVNTSPAEVILRVTAYSGSGDGTTSVVRSSETLSPYQWTQYSRVLDGTGISNGWVMVERVSGIGTFSAYGVVNDNATSDGSFIPAVRDVPSGNALTIPVIVETPRFLSELVLSNKGKSTVVLTLTYAESATPSLGAGGTVRVTLGPREQRIIPGAVAFLRGAGAAIGPVGEASYVGAVRIEVNGAELADIFAGARTAAPSSGGGQFGLFTPGVYVGEEAGDRAYVFGLRADAANRSNLAVVNTGGPLAGPVTLEIQVFDGGRDGIPAGPPELLSLDPGRWAQIDGILGKRGVSVGWVEVSRKAGNSPWIAYGVVNDGGAPGERTGDGAYVPMLRD